MVSKTDIKTRRPAHAKTKVQTSGAVAVRSNEPLYLQVVRALKDDIVSAVFPVGSQLPTEEELCARFSVSRYTIREALRRLREDGLVSSRQGAGTTVVPPRSSHSFVHEVMSINDLVAFATGVRFAIDSIALVEIDEKLALRTGLASGETRLAVRGFRYADDGALPICWSDVYINRQFAAVGRLLQRHRGPIFHLIEDMFGQSIVEVHQEISASVITAALAAGFKVKPGSTALQVRRTYTLATGTIAQVAINIHPASRFRHSMTMRRVKG